MSATMTTPPRPARLDRTSTTSTPSPGNSWSVHGGNHADETTGAIRTPIVMANSYRLPEDPSDIDDPGYQGLVYTREHGANQRGLEEKLAKLDHGEAAAVFGTGHGSPARRVLHHPQPRRPRHRVQRRLHARRRPLRRRVPERSSASRSTSSTSPTSTPSAPPYGPTPGSCTPRSSPTPTSESPTSPPWRPIAHDAGALLTIDSTFTPPPMMRPLDHGADLVIHSLTKYYNGHGDAMGGVVIGDPRPRRGDPHRRHVARRRRDLPVQRLAHHARLHHPAAAAAAAVRERPGRRGVPRR